MNMRISFMELFFPDYLKRKELLELFRITASAFQVPMPPVKGGSFKDVLHLFGVFTKEVALQEISREEDVDPVKKRLYDGAFQIGRELRDRMRIRSSRDAVKAAKLLYRSIGIEFQCNKMGEVEICRCYFSAFYPREVCWIISSIDQGIIAGLTEGARFWFLSRITEGSRSCVGQIEFKEIEQD